jgi:hypothetical protein
MSDFITLAVKNAGALAEGFTKSQALSQKWGRQELLRGGKRVVRLFKKEWLSGAPGIKGGQFKKGKHVFFFPRFGAVDDVAVGISRILRVHEEGAEIKARSGFLYLTKKTGIAGKGTIVAKVRRVKIPARTHFRILVRGLAPDIAVRVGKANMRAIEHTMKLTLAKVV